MIHAPAPWHLTGDAYIMLYRFPKNFVKENGFLADYQKDNFEGYWGTVMLVNYQTSGVGPYYELLFIPGMFNFDGKNYFSISKIYVSSEESVVNGIENWGIPKEKADFEWNEHEIVIRKDGVEFFRASFKTGWLKFPLTTAFFPLKVVQKLRENLIFTAPSAKGKAQTCSLENIKVNPHYFPDLTQVNPLMSLQVRAFEMVFPVPNIKKIIS